MAANDFKLKTVKSVNVNIWFFMQRLNLIKHYVNLKYGLGLELGISDGWAVMAHGGRVNGFTGTLRSIPDARLTMAALYNSDGSGMGKFSAGQRKIKDEALKLGLQALGVA